MVMTAGAMRVGVPFAVACGNGEGDLEIRCRCRCRSVTTLYPAIAVVRDL
jgi:hypothetical protein